MGTPRNLSKLAENTDSSGVLGIASGGTGGSTAAAAKSALNLHAVASSGSYADLNNKPTTANITEDTNLYYTDARARAAVSVSGSLSYNSTTGVFSYTTPSTSGVTEGTNLYFTDARVRAAVSAGTNLSYNSTTGVFSTTLTQYTDALARAAVSAGTGLSYNSSTGVFSTSLTQYTDALARAAVSASGSLSYNSTTGVFSYTTPSTSGIAEGSNLYYTDARVRAAVSATGSLSYNSTTGVFSYTTPSTSGIAEGSNLYYTDTRARAAHSAGTGISYNSTTGAISSTITQYTDALARAAVSAGTGLSYNSSTGVFTNTITQYTDALAVSANTSAIATAKSEAIASAATDATNKANAAQAAAISAVTNGAGAAFDTLKEIQDAMATDAELAAAIASITVGNATQTISAGTGLSGGGSFTANQTAASTVTLSLGTAGTSGTYTKVTTDAYGRVTSGTTLSSGDIPSLSGLYLPLTGGTLTGNVTLDTGNGEILVTPTGWRSSDRAAIKIRSKANTPAEIDLRHTVGGVESGWHISARDTSAESELHLYRFNMTSAGAVDAAGSFLQMFTFKANGGFNSAGAITQAGNQVLHAGNVGTYALPLSGDYTRSGTTTLSGVTVFNNYISLNGDFYHNGNQYILNAAQDGWINIVNRNGGSPFLNNVTYNGSTILHAGNYSSYALPLTGGTLSGELRVNTIRDTAGGWVLGKYGTEVSLGSAGLVNEIRFNSSADAAFEYRGNAILHAGNYNSYSPTLTGGGASGTWAINITGSAPLATNAIRIQYNDGPRDLSDRLPNSFTRTVNFDFVGAAAGNGSGNYAGVMTYSPWSGTTASTGDSSYQLAFANTTGLNASGQPKLSIRNGIDSTWNAWYTLLHSGNVDSYALPLTGGTLSGAFTVNNAFSTFSKNAASGANEVAKFINSGGGYSSRIYIGANPGADWLIGKDCYGAGTDRFQIGSWNGYAYIDIAYNTTAGTINFPNNGGLTVNSNTILHAGNYGSYALPLSGGTVAGPVTITGNDNQLIIDATSGPTAGIFLKHSGVNRWEIYNSSTSSFGLYNYTTGQSEFTIANATGVANFRNTPTAGGNAILHAGNWTNYVQVSYSGWPGYPGTDANTFLGGSWVRTSFTYSNNAPLTGTIATFPSGGYDLQLNANYNGHDLYFRSRNGDAGSWLSWKRVLTDNNYTSYSPSLTGSGASGTWGISVTGNAATAGGLAVHNTQSTQNSANQIVRTQDNGYTMLGWINTTSGDSGIANRLTRIYSSYDEYVRYSTLTDFKVHMGLSAKNNYSRRIDYTSDANYHVGSMGHSGYGANETFHGGSGFFDIWSGTNYPPSTSHIHGFNALHYTTNSLGSTGGNAYGIQVAGQYDQGGLLFSRACSGGSFTSWRRQIDDNNYSSYALPLSGGTVSGNLGLGVAPDLRLSVNGDSHFVGVLHMGGTAGSVGSWGSRDYTTSGSRYTNANYFEVNNYGYGYTWTFALDNSSARYKSNAILHAGNYTSYSPSLSGSGASGTWAINVTGSSGITNVMGSSGYGSGTYTWRQDSGTFAGYNGWASHLISNHGDGATYYNQTIIMPFWSAPQYSRLEGGTFRGPYTFITTENYNSYTYALAAKANRANGNFYIDDNYGNGVVGVYSSYRYQGVFAMGDSYKLPADGTTTGSLYGMAWSHPNTGGAAGNLSSHGLLLLQNGGFMCALSTSIVASANITAYSDERLKTNWRSMPDNFVARLAQVRVGIYDRIDEENTTQVGVSAQSFQELLPQAIMTAKDEMGTLSVSYGNAALASAVELAKEVVDLKTRVAQLEALINKLIKE